MEVKLRRSALHDLEAGVRFYERQELGLGRYFAETLGAEIEALADTGGIHPKAFGRYHKLVSVKFPYVVYYFVEHNQVVICAVFDCRRNPERIRKRLS